ncbi:hypothetical protein HYH03_006630 [Edaphochlamys debaryana]|uniref:Uncharacterized protein n=1 Tax=Edaphochlamys debaryana TaxID=47281 RepID=A0A835Y2L0_9CHLO|nr:hypothetical protein HYH03_006630 [Edaphochlamys debaryana]|eukprot:KAG2495362.1 hypothetical protein HYH03_006630 [Edaphochlamys debaryana]
MAELSARILQSSDTDDGAEEADNTVPLRIAAVFVVLAAGLIGGLPPLFLKAFRDTQSTLTKLIRSFSAGVILALALVHIIPESSMEGVGGMTYPLGGVCVVLGVVVMILIEHAAHAWHSTAADGAPHPTHAAHSLPAPGACTADDADVSFSDQRKPSSKRAAALPPVADLEAPMMPPLQDAASDCDDSASGQPQPHRHVCVSHGPALNWLSAASAEGEGSRRNRVVAMLFELGCIFHSVIIGLSLGVNQTDLTEVRSLLIALAFHQWLEGIGLASVIVRGGFSRLKGCGMVLAYALTCPAGIAIGIAVAASYDPESELALGLQGAFNGVSGGMLLYISLVQLVAEDMSLMLPGRNSALIRMGCFTALATGAAAMCILAIWA